MKKSIRFFPEICGLAVRMMQERRGQYRSLWTAADSIAPKIGCMPQTLLMWVQRHEVDSSVCDGVSSAEARRGGSRISSVRSRRCVGPTRS